MENILNINKNLQNINKSIKKGSLRIRFKNYRNSYTNDNRIYTKNEMLDMTVREIKDRADEFIAQHKVLGLPDESELSQSDNVVHVEAYTREDGTEVKAHWRSKPGVNSDENSVNNRADSANNENNYDNADWDDNPEGSQEYYESQKYEENEEYKKEYREREKQKSIERKDPDEIAGVKRGEPKTFLEAAQIGVNPNIGDNEKTNVGYDNNCTSCALAFEAQQRGYDVEAVSGKLPIIDDKLSWDYSGGYIDPVSKKPCNYSEVSLDDVGCYEYFDGNMKNGERYQLVYYNEAYENVPGSGHVINVNKNEKGEIIVYDPQTGNGGFGESAKQYLGDFVESPSNLRTFKILRVDDKAFNPEYINKVVKPRSKR